MLPPKYSTLNTMFDKVKARNPDVSPSLERDTTPWSPRLTACLIEHPSLFDRVITIDIPKHINVKHDHICQLISCMEDSSENHEDNLFVQNLSLLLRRINEI